MGFRVDLAIGDSLCSLWRLTNAEKAVILDLSETFAEGVIARVVQVDELAAIWAEHKLEFES